MKRKVALVLCLLVIGSVAFANQFGVEVKKSVNDGFEVSMPVKIDAQSKLPFLPKAYLSATPIFTAPRGDFFEKMKSLNHSRMDAVIGGGIKLFGGDLELETGASYWWAGNNEGVPEGIVWNNAFRYVWNW
jgi:hypothetical protein